MTGYLETLGAKVKTGGKTPPLEDVSGRFQFTPNQITWSEIDLKYDGINYVSSGTLTNFNSPGIQLDLASKDLNLKSVFAVNDKELK